MLSVSLSGEYALFLTGRPGGPAPRTARFGEKACATTGYLFNTLYLKVESDISKAYHDLWSLVPPSPKDTLRHNFLTISSGHQIHYLTATPQTRRRSSQQSRQLIVFIHGFPDSCHIFSQHLTSKKLRFTGVTLVSIDLPGFGGSDCLDRQGGEEDINAVIESITRLKQRYLVHEGIGKSTCVLVGHDWGGIVTSRLGSETEGLVDRIILINSVHVSQLLRVHVTRPS